ncbi:hypothetical protein PR003_g20259 [Phytophthora rubi]|uniref:Transmembrane protein n=1 Tax=Phytophthora rubi TaxID=129364 RepID=A0A6A4DPR8_9STRA|nr:hypothetical protein PR001_g18976 [Phytophthora rubi]KAE9310472.1 hypothetical protein PR003_g20259 [Phytophthora rubi]
MRGASASSPGDDEDFPMDDITAEDLPRVKSKAKREHEPRPSTYIPSDQLLQPPEALSLPRIGFLLYRTTVFATAVAFIVMSLQSFSTAIQVLRGSVSHDLPVEIHTANLITNYVASAQSFTTCSDLPDFNEKVYSNEFLRFIFSRLQAHASYNLSYVTELELIVPVVDCTFDLLVSGDRTVARVYYLVRKKSDPTQVMLLSTSLSAQDYEVGQQFQRGPGMVLLIAAIGDMRVKTLKYHIAVALNYPYVADPEFLYSELQGVDGDNYWLLQMLPNQRNLDPAKDVRMARRFGRYKGDPTSQSNIETARLELSSDPASELREWRWYSRAVLHDSWAWTHATLGIFELSVIFDLSVLTFVIYRRLRAGHVWVGDAFSICCCIAVYWC